MAEEGDLKINGKTYDPEDMTFREQREMRRIVREELVQDPDVDFEALTLSELIPAIAVVLVRRDNPAYTLDEALDLKMRDIYVTAADVKAEKAKKAPPTSRGSSKRLTSVASGTPA